MPSFSHNTKPVLSHFTVLLFIKCNIVHWMFLFIKHGYQGWQLEQKGSTNKLTINMNCHGMAAISFLFVLPHVGKHAVDIS